jgi:hypothetical protein
MYENMTVMRTKKVKKILDLVEKFGVCNSEQVANLVYAHYKNPKVAKIHASAKLKNLYDNKLLKRDRAHINAKYFYFTSKKPKQVEHRLYAVDLYIKLVNFYGETNVDMIIHYNGIKGIESDALITIKKDKYIYYFFLEVHYSSKQFNVEKYENIFNDQSFINIYPKEILEKNKKLQFPKILVMTDRKIDTSNKCGIQFIILDMELTDLENKLNLNPPSKVINGY